MRLDEITLRLIDAWPVEFRSYETEPTHYRVEIHTRVNGHSRCVVSGEIRRSDLRSKLDVVIDAMKRELVRKIMESNKDFFTADEPENKS
jgi:ribosome-associated translation inhibitor RaiA